MNGRINLKLLVFILFLFFFLKPGFLFSSDKEIDKSQIPFLRWMGESNPGSYEEYKLNRIKKPFFIKPLSVLNQYWKIAEKKKKVLIITNTNIFQSLSSKIITYGNSLTNQGYQVKLYESSGGSPESLKNFISAEISDLIGCVLVGKLPVAWYEVENDYFEYGYAEFPCDLFLMDLDGSWQDSNGNGKYDIHFDGTGDRNPEIFIGRIDASSMNGNELQILSDYFDKNSEYWNGGIFRQHFGLTYTEDDWSIYEDMIHDINHLCGDRYETISAPDTNRDDYLDNRLKSVKYEFVQLACHSNSTAHYFTRNGLLYNHEVKNAPPQGIGYNLFCCSALRFTDANFIGGVYIFNPGRRALVTIGSTKTGSMLEFRYFYQSLGEKKPVGQALKEWFDKIAPYDIYDLFWHYGMTIVGDPLIKFTIEGIDVFSPLDLSGSKQENHSLLLKEYVNVLGWSSNPANDNKGVTGYRIYWLKQNGCEKLSDVSPDILEYMHRGVNLGEKYLYGVVSLDAKGKESPPALIEVE